MGRVFANGPGDLGSIPGCVIPKTLKRVLDTSLLKTQYLQEIQTCLSKCASSGLLAFNYTFCIIFRVERNFVNGTLGKVLYTCLSTLNKTPLRFVSIEV